MPYGRRLISPGAAGGIGMLTMFLGVVLAGTLHTEANRIEGVAYAQEEAPPRIESPAAPAEPESPAAERGAPTEAPPTAPESPAAAEAAETPAAPAPQATPRRPSSPASQPRGTVRLARGGTATLVRRELGTDGVLPIPSSIHQATWWGAGLDATQGATVLAGHVNWRGATGPFAELWQSKAGQRVVVVDQAGRASTYRIAEVVTLHKDELPRRAQELFAQDGPHRLVLVTCGGRWVGGDQGYASNQIVIATRQ